MSYGWRTTGHGSGERVAEQRVGCRWTSCRRVGGTWTSGTTLSRGWKWSGCRNAVVCGLPGNVKGFIFVAAHCRKECGLVWSEKESGQESEDAGIPDLSISAYGRDLVKDPEPGDTKGISARVDSIILGGKVHFIPTGVPCQEPWHYLLIISYGMKQT